MMVLHSDVTGTKAQVNHLNQEARRLVGSNPRQADLIAQQSYKLSIELIPPYHKGAADSLLIKAATYRQHSQYELAFHASQRALSIYQDMDLLEEELFAAYELFTTHTYLSEYPQALKIALDALKKSEMGVSKSLRAKLFKGIGRLYLELNELDQALNYLENSIALYRALDEPDDLADALSHYGVICSRIESCDDALPHLFEARKISQKTLNRHNEIAVLNKIARVYIKSGILNEATQYLCEAFDLATRIQDLDGQIDVLCLQAQLELAADRVMHSINSLRQAFTIATDQMLIRKQVNIHRDLAAVYQHKGDYKNALYHHQQYHALHTKVFNEDADERMKTLQIIHDVEATRREIAAKEAQNEELQTLYEQVSQLEQLKTDMIRIAAHDLRGPVSTIASYLDLMLKFDLAENETEEYLMTMQDLSYRVLSMMNEILSLERIQQLANGLEHKPVPLCEIVRDVIDLNQEAITRKQLKFTQSLCPQTTTCTIMADIAQVEEAVSNLVTNAIKYTPEGGEISIIVDVLDAAVQFVVKDTGYGIPEELQEKLFDPFYRVKTKETKDIEGTGIGLHLVKSIVERHNGEIIFKSIYGAGSTFGFRLPLSSD